MTLWLNARELRLPLPAPEPLLLEVLAAHGIAYDLRVRAWANPALGREPLLAQVADLAGPLEIVVNDRLAAHGIARLRVRSGDTVVIGQLHHLAARFTWFRLPQ